MRELSFLAIVFFCSKPIFSQSQPDSLHVNIKIVKEYQVARGKKYIEYMYGQYISIDKDTVFENHFDIEVALVNSSAKPMFIWLMSTYWEQNFRINNNYAYIDGRDFDHNYPTVVRIKPQDSVLYHTTLVKSIKFDFPCENCIYGKQVETTKLGLVLVDDIFKPRLDVSGYNLAMEDESVWRTIWSNPLYLLTKAEANPEPMQIPVYKTGN